MAKYSLDFKLEVIQFYLSGHGYRQAAIHFNIERSTVQKWVRFYEAHGIEGIKPRASQCKYSSDFKSHVVSVMIQKGLSAIETAIYFNVPSIPTVLEWQSLFEKGGITALEPQRKGRPKQMKLPKKPDNRTEQEKLIDKLEAELAYLRAENAVLKKFQELDAKEEMLRKKRLSQKNSK